MIDEDSNHKDDRDEIRKQRDLWVGSVRYADTRQNQTDDHFTFGQITAASIIFGFATAFSRDFLSLQALEKLLLSGGLILLVLSLFFGLIHFRNKRIFWARNGSLFSKSVALWNSVLHNKISKEEAQSSQDQMLGSSEFLQQESWASNRQSVTLSIGTLLILLAVILNLFC